MCTQVCLSRGPPKINFRIGSQANQRDLETSVSSAGCVAGPLACLPPGCSVKMLTTEARGFELEEEVRVCWNSSASSQVSPAPPFRGGPAGKDPLGGPLWSSWPTVGVTMLHRGTDHPALHFWRGENVFRPSHPTEMLEKPLPVLGPLPSSPQEKSPSQASRGGGLYGHLC